MNLAGTEHSIRINGTITANLDFTNEVTAHIDTLRDLKFQVLETSFDVIVGRPDILKYQIGDRIPRFFGATPRSGQVLGAVVPASMAFGMCGTCPCRDATKLVTPVTCMPLGSLCNPCDLVDGLLNTHIDTMHAAQSTSDYRTRQQQTNVLASIVVPKSQFLDPIDDSDYIEWKEDPYSATASSDGSPEALLNLISYGGSPELQGRLRTLCHEFVDIFCETVRPEPAQVPPMKLTVNAAE